MASARVSPRLVCVLCLGVPWGAPIPAAAADQSQPCSGSDATLDCVERNLPARRSTQSPQLWTVLHERADAALERARRGEGCGRKGEVAKFLSLVPVAGDGDLGEFYAERVERLCLVATRCFRKASAFVDETVRDALYEMLDNPLINDREALARAQCLGDASPKARPEGRMRPGEAGAWIVGQHYLATAYDAVGDPLGLVKSGPKSTSTGDFPASCLAKRMSIVSSLELLGSEVSGDKATVAVRYRSIGDIHDGLVRLGPEADESMGLDLVRDSGGWWIARPYVPHVSPGGLLDCLKREYEKVDASWWEHASDAQKTLVVNMRASIAELRAVSREAFLGILEDPQVQGMRESMAGASSW